MFIFLFLPINVIQADSTLLINATINYSFILSSYSENEWKNRKIQDFGFLIETFSSNLTMTEFHYISDNDSLFESLFYLYLSIKDKKFYFDENGSIPAQRHPPSMPPFFTPPDFNYNESYTSGYYFSSTGIPIYFNIVKTRELYSLLIDGKEKNVEAWKLKM